MIKKSVVALLCLLFSTAVFADRGEIISLQEEILSLARQRHALVGDNLDIRAQMIGVMKKHQSSDDKQAFQSEIKPLKEKLQSNRKKIEQITKQIKAKKKKLKSLNKSRRGKRKGKNHGHMEDVTPSE